MNRIFALLFVFLIACNNNENNDVGHTRDLNTDSLIISESSPALKDKYQRPTKHSYNLPNNEILNFYIEIDSSLRINNEEFGQFEFFELLKINQSGELEIIIPKTNFLEVLCKSFISVEIVNNQFKIIYPCNSRTPKIKIEKRNSKDYYLSYWTDSLQFEKKIIWSTSLFGGDLKKKDIMDYSGKYVQIWLQDQKTGIIDDRFVAIGSSNKLSVYEFHFPYNLVSSGLYFADESVIKNKEIEIVKETCN